MQTQDGIIFHKLQPSSLGIFAPHFSGHRAVPVLARDAFARSGAQVILDGPMFAFCGSLPRERCVEALYMLYDRRRGVDVSSQRPDAGVTISTKGNSVVIMDRAEKRADIDVAIQLYPELIRHGNVVTSSFVDTSNVWRAALGWDGHSFVFAVGQGSMHAFATKLRRLGIIEAGYTDGGGSAEIMSASFRAGNEEDRPKAAWLLDAPQSQALAEDGTLLLAAIAVGAAIWFAGS